MDVLDYPSRNEQTQFNYVLLVLLAKHHPLFILIRRQSHFNRAELQNTRLIKQIYGEVVKPD